MNERPSTGIHEPPEGDEVQLSGATGAAEEPSGTPAAGLGKGRSRLSLGSVAADYGVVITLVVMVVFFCLLLGDKFASWDNAKTIVTEQAILGVLALAVIIPLTVGEFDLSIAANLGFCAVVTAYFASKGMSPALILPLVVVIGMVIGAVNAVLVRIGLNAFIATLGISTILTGGNLLITEGSLIKAGSDALTSVTHTELFGIDLSVYYFLALAVVMYYLYEWTPIGRFLRATGLGREAARLTGVRTTFWLPAAFISAGAIAGFAGYLHTSTYGTVPPTTGPEYLLPAYAAAFLGATTVLRGFFNVWGTVVGLYLLAVGTTGLALAGAPFWVQPVFNGTALVVAVTFAVLADRQRRATSA